MKGISPDGNWAYVDGQYGAVPMAELLPEKAPENPPKPVGLPLQGKQLPQQRMQEFVVPLSDGSKAVFQWPSNLSKDDIADLQDSLKIVERKILRSVVEQTSDQEPSS